MYLCVCLPVCESFTRLFSLVSHPKDKDVLREPVKDLLKLFFAAVDLAPQRNFGNHFVPVIWEVLLNSCSQTPPLAND